MANKNISGLTSLLKRLRPFSGLPRTSFEHQGCSWSRVRSLHASCQAATPPVLSVTSPSEAKLKEPAVPDRLVWKLEIQCQGHDKAVMRSYGKFLQMTCQHLGINAGPAVYGTPSHERITLLKSVHIHGKHRVQYEMQTYPLDLTAYHLTGSTADTFLEYVQRMCPEGIIMKVTEHTLNKFPASMMQVLTNARTKNKGSTKEAGGSEEIEGAAKEDEDSEKTGGAAKEAGDSEKTGGAAEEAGDSEKAGAAAEEAGDSEKAGGAAEEAGDLEKAGGAAEEAGDLEKAGGAAEEAEDSKKAGGAAEEAEDNTVATDK